MSCMSPYSMPLCTIFTKLPAPASPTQSQQGMSLFGPTFAEIAWKMAIQARDQKEDAWDTVITARANNCEAVTPTDLAALQSTGFPLRSASTPVGELPAPGDLRATARKEEGQIDLRCDTVAGANSYEWQFRPHADNGAGQAIKASTTRKIVATNLTPGQLYAFRVRAIGAAGPGTWSDEAVERAP